VPLPRRERPQVGARLRSLAVVVTVLGAAAAVGASASEPPVPAPFVAKFAIEWKGLTAGYSQLELTRTAPNAYTYKSRNVARGIFRLAFPDAISQSSSFSIVDGGVRPSSYHADDGARDSGKTVTLQFDWQTRRVTGVSEGKPVDLALEPGTQDALSVQIELMHELAEGRAPKRFWLIDNDEIKEYQYVREGTVTLDTPLGKLAAVIYRSERAGSDRVTRLWLAPSLGNLPVRAERSRAGKIDFALSIRELRRN
jgi:Protein of unknown function (DUF3108)